MGPFSNAPSAERLFQEQQKLRAENAKKHFCPTCKNSMFDVGSLTIASPKNEAINGDYCGACYSEFLAKSIPKFVCDAEPAKKSETNL